MRAQGVKRESSFGNTVRPERRIDFARLVGSAGWVRLPVAVRERFGAHQTYAKTKVYAGTMQRVEASLPGRIIAHLCRLIGTPLAPYVGSNVPTEVKLYKERGGICWERIYAFSGKRLLSVKSVKILDARRGLLECVGAGFGMTLRVYEQDQALHFLSTGFFWQAGPLRIPLPDLLSPGRTHVIHTDLGGGFFRFTMTIRHQWFGETFYQSGIFSEKGDRS